MRSLKNVITGTRLAAAALGLLCLAITASLAAMSCSSNDNGPGDAGDDGYYEAAQITCDADTQTDPHHCGSCTTSCNTGEACKGGFCQRECNPPLQKCTLDSGCVDLSKDLNNCGVCGRVCGAQEGGAPDPDGGVPHAEGGTPAYDGGPDGSIPFNGQYVGEPSCQSSNCVVLCPSGTSLCNGQCIDLYESNDHCGDCNTSCDPGSQFCSAGFCCSQNQANCGLPPIDAGADAEAGPPPNPCIDLTTDPNNCGTCGHICDQDGGTPHCIAGQCVANVTYTASLTTGVNYMATDPQCTDWIKFQSELGGTFSSVTIKGSRDAVGVTCSGSAANLICQSIHTGTNIQLSCGGRTWETGNCYSSGQFELNANGPGTFGTCQCTATPAYTVRPCPNSAFLPTGAWGAVKDNDCSPVSQTITVICQ
jgi:hypothetical protein